MCGLCGELSFIDRPVRENDLTRMTEALVHRGPDDHGQYLDGPIGLGHRRLSILDVTQRGRQPMWSSDGRLCIVFNGEVYNFRELGRELEGKGFQFRSSGDTDVVVHAIRHWGLEDAVRRFIGMFAFAVWDTGSQELALVRDRAGVKPLFYWRGRDRVLFGSEMRALFAHPGFPRRIDPNGLGQQMVAGFTFGPTTVMDGVHRVEPGCGLVFDRSGGERRFKYWSLDDVERSSGFLDPASVEDELLQLLESAFAYRLVSDVPLATFLSGGIDSSLLAAVLRQRLDRDLLNITIGFEEAAFDEAPKARRVAEQLGVRHEIHYVRGADAQSELLNFTEVFDEPFGDTSGIPTLILSRIARRHVKVALSADGGDEQFCGYDSYARYDRAARILGRVPLSLRRAVGASASRWLPYRSMLALTSRLGRYGMRPNWVARADKALRFLDVESPADLGRLMYEKAWSWDGVREVVRQVNGQVLSGTVLADPGLAARSDDLVDMMMRLDYNAFLPDDVLTKVDRASMHVSLEARDPFLDHRIAEFAFRLPTSFVFRGGEHKWILKRLLRRWVSDDVVSAPKRGFSIPLYAWMRGVWKPIVLDTLTKDTVDRVGLLDPTVVTGEVTRFYERPGGSAERLWMMLNLHLWADRWLAQPVTHG